MEKTIKQHNLNPKLSVRYPPRIGPTKLTNSMNKLFIVAAISFTFILSIDLSIFLIFFESITNPGIKIGTHQIPIIINPIIIIIIIIGEWDNEGTR